jgi:hypothetical protein
MLLLIIAKQKRQYRSNNEAENNYYKINSFHHGVSMEEKLFSGIIVNAK